jgi:uncharacterized oligopeptide transporter (OPT) family protein
LLTCLGFRYVLFSEAYPCINDLSLQATCSFPAPDVGAWRAIAVAVTSPTLPIPPSSGYTSIAFGILAVIITVVKYRWVPVDKRGWVPNLNAIGIAFILNTTTYPTASRLPLRVIILGRLLTRTVAFGSSFVFLWRKNYPMAYGMYGYAVAAGFIAGEGLGGIVGAVLQVRFLIFDFSSDLYTPLCDEILTWRYLGRKSQRKLQRYCHRLPSI